MTAEQTRLTTAAESADSAAGGVQPGSEIARTGVPGTLDSRDLATGRGPLLPRWLTGPAWRVIRGQAVRSERASCTRWVLLVWLVALIAVTANHPGQIFFDTKLGVDIDPAGFYVRLWQLWNPFEWFGTLQDQYIGYAAPMAPFYLVGQLLRAPVWITERVWLALLITVGFAGMAKLTRALRIGSPWSQVAAGLAFAAWPTFTIVIGSTSAGILPGLLAPWAVLPLVSAARGGSLPRAAARSGVAVLAMGGVNATSTLYCLILPALFIVTQLTGRRRVGLAACWTAATGLATCWWTVPLLLQAKYAFNFLPYVEQSATTTGTMSAATFLRGAGNWTAYLNLGQPWLSAGWAMVADPLAICAGAVAAGAGLFGLARRDIPRANWLRLSLAGSALIALAGYPGPLGGIFSRNVGQLLDGGLAPLRSVYKVEPVAAAVLAIGIAHLLAVASRPPAGAGGSAGPRQPADAGATARKPADSGAATRRVAWLAGAGAAARRVPAWLVGAGAVMRRMPRRLLLGLVAGLVIAGLATPYLTGQILNPGSFAAVPRYWYQLAAYLRLHSPDAPALVVPAAAHGTYLWGEPIDEPLEPLASSPWAALALVPYGGAGSQLLLSSLEGAISSGERIPGLAVTLRRSGIRYVVVRNDLAPSAIGYIPPGTVHQSLQNSGFHRIASFGPLITGAQYDPGAVAVQYALPAYPAVEVYVAGLASGEAPPPVAVLPVSKTVLLNGGPDALLQLTGQQILSTQPAVLAGDRLVARPALWAVTDSLRRADHAFGVVDSAASYTYTATENNPVDDPLGGAGEPPRQLLPVPGRDHQTVAVLSGAASVTASSSGSWLAETPQIDPVNAFDGNPSTVWVQANPVSAVGQWIQITFDHPLSLPDTIGVRLLDDGSFRATAARLTVSTATGAITSDVRRTGRAQPLQVPPGPTRFLRITFAAVSGGVPDGPGAGLADVLIPGVSVRRFLRVPQSAAGQQAPSTTFSFQRQVPSPASLADVTAYPPMARTFSDPIPAVFRLAASALAVPGRQLDAILGQYAPVGKHGLVVSASSTYGSLPGLAAAGLFAHGITNPWIAGGGSDPAIRLSWRGKRVIGRMVIQPLPGFAAAPQSIKITSPDGVRFASVGIDGLTELVPPLRTDRMTISFPVVQFATTTQSFSGQFAQLPVGLSKLDIPALAGLRAAAPDPATPFRLECGQGPEITIDRHRYATTVSGTIGDLIRFYPVQVEVCSPGSVLRLGAGRHWLITAARGPFTITDLSLTSTASASGSASRAPASGRGTGGGAIRAVRVLTWQPESRRVLVGAGAASYLELHQNVNAGWVATLNGAPLTPVTLDGWQQAYVVPAGSGGVVTLTFAPITFYHSWIILSAAGTLVLLAAAFARQRRRRAGERMDGQVSGEPGSEGLARETDPAPSRRGPVVVALGLLALTALIAVIGGPVALAVPVLAVLGYWMPRWFGLIALAAMAAAGLLTALAAHPAASGTGAFGSAAQACALVALAVALTPDVSLTGVRRRPQRPGWLSLPGLRVRRRAGTA